MFRSALYANKSINMKEFELHKPLEYHYHQKDPCHILSQKSCSYASLSFNDDKVVLSYSIPLLDTIQTYFIHDFIFPRNNNITYLHNLKLNILVVYIFNVL
jgi:hypothetical protein